MFRILLVLLLCSGQNVFGWNSEADSLRNLGEFEKELHIRKKAGAGFDLDLARANVWINLSEYGKADAILKRLVPRDGEQHFWKNKSLAASFQGKGDTEKALEILKNLAVKEGSLHAALKEMALAKIADPLTAIQHLEKASSTFENSEFAHHYLAGLVLSDLAFAYDEAGLRNKTTDYGDRALRFFIRNYPAEFPIISTSHNNLLFYLIDYGDEKRASEVQRSYSSYMEKFLAGKNRTKMALTHAEGLYRLSNLRYYGFKKDLENLLLHLGLLERFFQTASPEWVNQNKGMLSAGYEIVQYCLRQQGKLDMALQYAQMVDKAEQKPYNRMKKYAALALTHYDAGNNAEALKNVDLCLAAFDFSPASKSLQTLMALKAELLSRLGKTVQAKETLDKIYQEILGEGVDVRKAQIEKYPQHVNTVFLNLLIHSAWAYQNINAQSEDYLTPRDFFHQAGRVFEKYYQNGVYNAQLGRLLDQIEDGLFHNPLPLSEAEVIRDLNQVEAISNAHVWSRFSSRYLQNLNLPKEEIEQKNHLQLKRNILARTYESELRHHNEIGEIDLQLKAIERKLSDISPEYSEMSNAGFDIRKIQKSLKPGEAIIKYTLGEKKVYGHVITREKVILRTLGEISRLQSATERYLSDLTNIRHPQSEIQNALENTLLAPLNPEKYSSLIFISEGFLSYVPFEILLHKPLPVSYAFSFKNLILNRTNARLAHLSDRLAGFVPSYPWGSSGTPLPYSVQELKNIRTQLGAITLFEGERANKAAFIKSLGKFKMHHLAMHSEMDEEDYEQSSLLFTGNERLYFHELYALNFPSELVVLSACNTGRGKYLNGEGVMSLARALTYAGVHSSVASLWQVPDKESAELMTLFYRFLADGKPKDEALMLAKRTFTEKYPMKTHPYYWAGFILSGDTAPLRTSGMRWWIMGCGGVMIFILLVLRRRLKPL